MLACAPVSMAHRGLLATAICGVAACGGGGGGDGAGGGAGAGAPTSEALFPADFQSHYLEMRDCRHSHEHELRFIRVFASSSAQEPYRALDAAVPYPVGAQLVKVEYDDEACATVLGYTVMEKLPEGDEPAGGDWRWQSLNAELEVEEDGAPSRCVTCHEHHCAPPFGYDLSCAEEL